MGHKKVICKKCGKVILQCRCMDCNKTTEYSICDDCKNHIADVGKMVEGEYVLKDSLKEVKEKIFRDSERANISRELFNAFINALPTYKAGEGLNDAIDIIRGFLKNNNSRDNTPRVNAENYIINKFKFKMYEYFEWLKETKDENK